MERNHSIDVAKGFLILFVILGHAVQGVLEDHLLRYFIYSFHMGLFFFVSGYLINPTKIGNRRFGELMKHYGKRMMGWWLLAWFVFTPLRLYDDLSLQSIVDSIINPYYHLWYVPTLFFFILITYAMQKLTGSATRVCITLVAIGVITYISGFFLKIHWPGLFKLPFMLYFSLGMYCGNFKPKLLTKLNGGYVDMVTLHCMRDS